MPAGDNVALVAAAPMLALRKPFDGLGACERSPSASFKISLAMILNSPAVEGPFPYSRL